MSNIVKFPNQTVSIDVDTLKEIYSHLSNVYDYVGNIQENPKHTNHYKNGVFDEDDVETINKDTIRYKCNRIKETLDNILSTKGKV